MNRAPLLALVALLMLPATAIGTDGGLAAPGGERGGVAAPPAPAAPVAEAPPEAVPPAEPAPPGNFVHYGPNHVPADAGTPPIPATSGNEGVRDSARVSQWPSVEGSAAPARAPNGLVGASSPGASLEASASDAVVPLVPGLIALTALLAVALAVTTALRTGPARKPRRPDFAV